MKGHPLNWFAFGFCGATAVGLLLAGKPVALVVLNVILALGNLACALLPRTHPEDGRRERGR